MRDNWGFEDWTDEEARETFGDAAVDGLYTVYKRPMKERVGEAVWIVRTALSRAIRVLKTGK